MKIKKGNKLIFKLAILLSAIYAIYMGVKQQIDLNKYLKEEQYYISIIEQQNEVTQQLEQEKSSVQEDQYIERLAREKLGLIMPNEKIYIDAKRY